MNANAVAATKTGMKLGDKLIRLRDARGLTIQQAADALGLHKTQYDRYERYGSGTAAKAKAGGKAKEGGNRPYRAVSYYAAVMRAADKAGVPHWGLNRLRHNAATLIRKEFGIDAVQSALGHASVRVSELYASLDEQKAAEVAKRIG